MDAQIELERAMHRLQADYWARVDYLDAAPPEELFTDDSVFELGAITLRGRTELGEFFRRRREASDAAGRVTRHLSANLRLLRVEPESVEVATTVLVMTGYGAWPATSSIPSVGDFQDLCVLSGGHWRFRRRRATSVFAGPDAAPFARAAEPQRDPQ